MRCRRECLTHDSGRPSCPRLWFESCGLGPTSALNWRTMEGMQHDHSAHDAGTAAAGADHDKYHGSVLRREDGSYYYAHGEPEKSLAC